MSLPEPYYEDPASGIVIYCGDCRDILPALDAVDHVITDPPYEAEAHQRGRRQRFDGVVTERPLDFISMTECLRKEVGEEMAMHCTGWLLVFCQVEAAMTWRDVLLPAKYMRTQIWRKNDGAPQFTGDRPGMGYESIVTCWAGAGRSRWNGGGKHGCYDYLTVREGTGHLTEKPMGLMLELVSLFTDPGETILDPFMGSGTTLVAAKTLGRKAIGIELEAKWCEVAKRRLMYTEYKPRLLDYEPWTGKQPRMEALS